MNWQDESKIKELSQHQRQSFQDSSVSLGKLPKPSPKKLIYLQTAVYAQ